MDLKHKQKQKCIIRAREEGTNKIHIEENESLKLAGAPMVTKSRKRENPTWVLSKNVKNLNEEEESCPK